MLLRKNRRSMIIKNIEPVNIEIDYDKLAEAIVKAQNEAEQKTKKTGTILRIAMTICNVVVYLIIYSILAYATVIFWRQEAVGAQEIIAKVILIVLTIMLLALVFLLMGEAITGTKNEVQNHFNTNMTLAALVIALIALFQSNGIEEIIPYLEEIKNLLMN